MRRFVLLREQDVTGISGEGVVVWGMEFPDRYVVYRWNTAMSTTCLATSIDDVMGIHGHNGATRLLWLDTPEQAKLWELMQPEAKQADNTIVISTSAAPLRREVP